MRTDMLQQSLEELNGSTADIEASALISTDGLMIASALPHGMDEDRIVKAASGIRDTVVWKKLYKFQRDGVIGAIDKLERLGG